MDIRVWRSFSCNNSGSFYLVAKFDDPQKAAASAEEVTAFLAAHAKEVDTLWDEDGDPTETSTASELALAEKHGFEWEGFLLWGDEGAEGDEPGVAVAGDTVVLHHSYCGGFGEGLPKYFTALGAKPEEEVDGSPRLSVVLTIPTTDKGAALVSEVTEYFTQTFPEDDDYPEEWSVSAPWGEDGTNMVYEGSEAFAFFSDTATVGFTMPFNLRGVDELTAYLAKHGVADYALALERDDVDRFRTIASASCPECKTADVRFLEAAAHDAPADQIACKSCGGMFALSDFPVPPRSED